MTRPRDKARGHADERYDHDATVERSPGQLHPTVYSIPVSDPRVLRELASLLERRERRWSIEGWEIRPTGLERLADIVAAGSIPTVGFYRRYGRRVKRRGTE